MSPKAKQAIAKAFADRPDLVQGLQGVIDRSPFDGETLIKLADYVSSLKTQSTNGSTPSSQPTTKKRKLDGDQEMADVGGSVLFTCSDISFSVPVRKKLRLEGLNGGLRGLDAAGNTEVSVSWDKIEHVFCLPVPDRAKPSNNFVILPSQEAPDVDPVVWTAPEQNPKNPDPTHTVDYVAQQLNNQLARFGKQVLYPDEADFVSEVGAKMGRKQFGVRAHRGSKEGHLFFLSPGILFAFKKPLLFLPFHNITSISYTSVLQRTFNLSIAAREPGTDTEIEIEFSMLDQEDYGGIDAYIKRHGLNDASLAATRRAKVYNVNAPKNAKAGADGSTAAPATQNGAAQDDGESEIQKAERMLQDAEDEDEEDYVEGQEDEEEYSSEDEDYASGDEEDAEEEEEDAADEE